ncbi:hypothetical protein ACX80U_18880 [Arthrobacter sp. TmT3-37]|uniref:hypothetical protein n=1 Tax=Arthrobacter sp. B1805 TaxID=2058892 RepID=UPI000CE37DA4|nr:hypothetical protein [Arthrobacter sp. B1805]
MNGPTRISAVTRPKIGVLLVSALGIFWLAVAFQRSFTLLGDPDLVAKSVGAAYLLIPLICIWALTHELRFGFRAQAMARILEREGGLTVDDLPRSPAGRIDRKAADEHFQQAKAAAEQAPDDWRTWYRLSCAYDTAGDRKRARQALRTAATLHHETTQPA